EAHAPRLLRATLRGPLDATRDRRTYRAARLFVAKDGGCEAVPLSWQGSGDPFGPATADGLIMRPPHAAAAADGEPVRVLPFRRGMPDGNRWPEVKTC
ncbi:MAG: hypothetical protein ACE5EX_07570, partial [Phycisphaerae bacterium]